MDVVNSPSLAEIILEILNSMLITHLATGYCRFPSFQASRENILFLTHSVWHHSLNLCTQRIC